MEERLIPYQMQESKTSKMQHGTGEEKEETIKQRKGQNCK